MEEEEETQVNNLCPVCGGVRRVEYTMGFEDGVPRDMRISQPPVLPPGEWRICAGHPVPAKPHDGYLNEDCDHVVQYHVMGDGATMIHLHDGDEHGWHLTPKEFLSLLAWGEQEKPKVQQLAKDQEEDE